MSLITIQPGQTSDATPDSFDPMLAMPYPYHILPDDTVDRQDFWRGSPARLVGFQRGNVNRIVLDPATWRADPQKAVGLRAVFMDEPSQVKKATGIPGVSMWADGRNIIRVDVHDLKAVQ